MDRTEPNKVAQNTSTQERPKAKHRNNYRKKSLENIPGKATQREALKPPIILLNFFLFNKITNCVGKIPECQY